jgi:hypothetical protein
MKSIITILSGLFLMSCDSREEMETSCSYDDTHLTFRATSQGKFLSSISFDIDAGVAFRGFEFIASATDMRKGVEIIYYSDTKTFLVKTERNNRLLKGVEKQCIIDLKEFLLRAKIEVPIVIQSEDKKGHP